MSLQHEDLTVCASHGEDATGVAGQVSEAARPLLGPWGAIRRGDLWIQGSLQCAEMLPGSHSQPQSTGEGDSPHFLPTLFSACLELLWRRVNSLEKRHKWVFVASLWMRGPWSENRGGRKLANLHAFTPDVSGVQSG